MFPQFQRVVTLSVMSILVGLFAWIYVRDRQPRARLWMIGWACIVAHFAGMLLFSFGLIPSRLADWSAYSTLVAAASAFFLSVCQTARTRLGPRAVLGRPSWRRRWLIGPAWSSRCRTRRCTAPCWPWRWAPAYGLRCASPDVGGQSGGLVCGGRGAGDMGRLARRPRTPKSAWIFSSSKALPSPAGAIGDTSAA